VAVPTELPRKDLPAESAKLDDILAQNTRVRVAGAEAQTAGRKAALARALLLPSIAAVGNLWMQSPDPAGAYKSGISGGVVLSIPIDAALFYRAKEAATRESQGHAELEQARLDAQERIRTAYLQAQDAAERIRATEAAVGYADEVLRIEQEKQRLGRSTIEALLDAQAALLSSQSNYYRALGDETIAVAAVDREAGPGAQETTR
jgi:outer membrane protein TolC